jgi:N-acyl-D-amino-acid deacylase
MIQGAFTWAAWFYRNFVNTTHKFTMQEAVRRLTSLPAERLRLKDRGVLRAGAWADIAIFDPNAFAERGTDFEPGQIATGIEHVLVNGQLTVRDGLITGKRSGRVLRRQ